MVIVSAVDFLQVKCRLSILCTNPYLRNNLYEKNDTANVIAAVIFNVIFTKYKLVSSISHIYILLKGRNLALRLDIYIDMQISSTSQRKQTLTQNILILFKKFGKVQRETRNQFLEKICSASLSSIK